MNTSNSANAFLSHVTSPQEADFWHDGPTVYQIYPRSFKATDGRPEGTIAGITEKLPYLKGGDDSLGIDAIWLTPFYKSSMKDGGYDVISYRDVDPRFGTIDDVRALITAAHERDIKVMVDLVPNHMSTESSWYKEASSSRDNSKSNWFIFRDAKSDGTLPNNWPSEFCGGAYNQETRTYEKVMQPVWRYVEKLDQYVMCSFSEYQADLNWHNPEVREAMKDEMRFLLDLGADGFRVDMVAHIGKNPDLLDEPANPNYDPACGDPNQALLIKYREGDPSLYAYMQEMTKVLEEYENRFMVTEDYIGGNNVVEKYIEYYKNVNPKKNAPFSFQGLEFMLPRTAVAYKAFYDKYFGSMEPDYVPTSVLGNHDQRRTVSRIGRDEARAAALMQLTFPGIPFIYYGEELGMEDVEIPAALIDDPYNDRDPERTPMLWAPGKNAGFTSGDKTWLPISPDWRDINVQAQLGDPNSFLNLYRRLIRLRNNSPALRRGAYVPIETQHGHVFGYTREYQSERLTMLVNFSGDMAVARVDEGAVKVVLSSRARAPIPDAAVMADTITLQPYEGVIVKVSP